MGIVYIVLLCTGVLLEVRARPYSNSLVVKNGGEWGSWGQRVFCPGGTYAVGYKMQTEAPRGDAADDTAMNNIALICSDDTVVDGRANSRMFGEWLDSRRCSGHRRLAAFQLRVEDNQGSGDDTAVNSIKFKCRDEGSVNATTLKVNRELEGFTGKWGIWSNQCSLSTEICGLQIRYETWKPNGDNTALNDVKLFCCNLHWN